MAQVTTKGHIVICGWNAKAGDILRELRLSKHFSKWPITVAEV